MEISYLDQVKMIIKSVVISSPDTLTVLQVNKDYKNIEGTDIPFRKLGYKTLEICLRSMSDAIAVYGNGLMAIVKPVTSEKSAHIEDFVNNQKKNQGRKTYSSHRNVQYRAPRCQISYNNFKSPDAQPQINSLYGNFISKQQAIPLYGNTVFDQKAIASCSNHTFHQQVNSLHSDAAPMQRVNHSHSNLACAPKNERSLSMNVNENKIDNNGVAISKNVSSNANVDCQKTTQKSAETFAFEHLQISGPEEKTKDISSRELNTFLTTEESDIDDSFKELIAVNPKEAPEFYKPKGETPKVVEDYSDNAIPDYAMNESIFELDYPKDAARFSVKIPTVEMPSVNSIVAIEIVKVFSPFNFFFRIVDEIKSEHPLKTSYVKLKMSMEDFYTNLNDVDFQIPKHCITVGQLCAAKRNYRWERGLILTTVNRSNCAEVFFIDYGTRAEVPQGLIKFLHKDYTCLPAQALNGRLSNVSPCETHWTDEAILYFKNITCNGILYGLITGIHNQTTARLILCDTNSKITKQINKLLIDNDYARYCVN